jgi:hypothetical protein
VENHPAGQVVYVRMKAVEALDGSIGQRGNLRERRLTLFVSEIRLPRDGRAPTRAGRIPD